VDAETVTRLRRVVGRLARQLNASATGEGLTPTQASVLGLVASRGPISIARLADLEQINPTMLSRVIGHLDTAGLLRRVPDPTDLRTASLEATADGLRVAERLRERRTAIVSECAERLSPAEADALTQALPALEALTRQLASRLAPTGSGGTAVRLH
jgi:DNA-binding MarR family transcriptional regulator